MLRRSSIVAESNQITSSSLSSSPMLSSQLIFRGSLVLALLVIASDCLGVVVCVYVLRAAVDLSSAMFHA